MKSPRPWIRIAVVALVASGAAYVAINRDLFDAEALVTHIDDYVVLCPLVFVLAHVAASLTFVPRTVMGLVAGLLFGLWWGIAWALTGCLAGAAAGFLLARYIGAGAAERVASPRLAGILAKAEAGGWRSVAVARLIPVVPHSLINYALGWTRIGLGPFLFGTLLGTAPTAIVFASLGAAGRTALEGAKDWLAPSLWAGVLVAAVMLAERGLARWRA